MFCLSVNTLHVGKICMTQVLMSLGGGYCNGEYLVSNRRKFWWSRASFSVIQAFRETCISQSMALILMFSGDKFKMIGDMLKWLLYVKEIFSSFRFTQCGLVMPYHCINRVNIASGNGLLPDGTKPLPEPILTYHQSCFLAFTWEQFRKKITLLK